MTIEQLMYVIEIHKSRSFTKAAQKCNVTIPGISQSVASLEKELGVVIFNRSRSGVTPTDKGMQIILKAYEILNKVKEMKEEINPHKLSGNLRIVASPSFIMKLLHSSFAFKKDYPDVSIELTEKSGPEVISAVKNNQFDLGFSFLNKEFLGDHSIWEYNTLIQESSYLCVSKHSKLASRNSVEPHEFIDQPLAIYNGVIQKRYINKFFMMYGEMNILFESNQVEVIKTATAEGFAVSFLNGFLLKDDQRVLNGEIIPLIIKEKKEFSKDRIEGMGFGWLRLKNTYFSPIVKEFIKYVDHYINKGNIKI